MKFLGIRNGHDQNISYSDGKHVRYFKLERILQQKHYNWGHDSGDELITLLKRTKNILDIDFRDIDAICYSNGTHEPHTDRPLFLNELFREVDKTKVSVWSQFSCPIYNIDHHYSHALSTWPLTDITKVKTHYVLDGLGDHGRITSIFKEDRLVEYIDRSENMGLSVTLEQIGQQIGINGMVLDISGKLMALKAMHQYPKSLEDEVLNVTKYLKYRHLNQFIEIIKQSFSKLHHFDDNQKLMAIAHMIHVFGEYKMPDYFSLYSNNNDIITYSGGTAQNTIVNTKLKERFSNLHIAPHCPDDGISLGCIEFLRKKFDQEYFDNSNFPFWQYDKAPDSTPSESTIDKTAELLAKGKIIGWYQGNGEIGPRALGNRSILMDPSIKGGKDIINKKVKKREPYRPFGASILLEDTEQFFDCNYESPYMLYVIKCKREEDFSSIIHLDGTCRIQTVNEQHQYSLYRDLITKFKNKTGIPMLLNTSLNVDGKPIAGYPEDAKTLYDTSDLDAVVIGNELIVK